MSCAVSCLRGVVLCAVLFCVVQCCGVLSVLWCVVGDVLCRGVLGCVGIVLTCGSCCIELCCTGMCCICITLCCVVLWL